MTTPPITASVGSPTPIPERPTLYLALTPGGLASGTFTTRDSAEVIAGRWTAGTVVVTIPGSTTTPDSGQGGEKKLAPLNMKYPATRDGAEAMCLDAIAVNPDGSVYDCLMLPNGAVASTLGNTQLAVEVIVDLMMRFARTKEAECSSGSSAGSSDTSPASVGTGSGMGTAKQTSTPLCTPSACGVASTCDTTQPTPSVGSGEDYDDSHLDHYHGPSQPTPTPALRAAGEEGGA